MGPDRKLQRRRASAINVADDCDGYRLTGVIQLTSVPETDGMKALARIRAASYDPEAIRAMMEAFDAAWASVHFHFFDSPERFEGARLQLANAILRAAATGDLNVEQMKVAALRSMAVRYRLEPSDIGRQAIMPQRVHNPRYWRNYAEETRTIADQMTDPECKRMLMGVAETYAALARRAIEAEKRLPRSGSRPTDDV